MPGVLDRLDAGAVRRWAVDALDRLRSHRDEIDGLNVFPVPDGDTGTNLCLTVESAVAAVEDVPDDDVREVADALATGALHGARGSSGVILSQLLQGWADALREHPDGGAGAVRSALARAADSAYAAVSRPSEGTMLSVARAAADGASRGGTLREVVSGALASARAALDRTPNQLDELGRAGVVDAGGRGLLLVLESLAGTVAGRRAARRPAAGDPARSPAGEPGHGNDAPGGPPEVGGPWFEVMYLVDLPEDAVPLLRERLDRVGDSVVVVGGPVVAGGRTWRVHIHTADVCAAVDAGAQAGSGSSPGTALAPNPAGTRPRTVRVTALVPPAASDPDRARPSVGVVAVASGPGLAQLLAASGALALVRDAQGPPAPEDLLTAVRDTCAEAVVVLPDGPDAAATAEVAVAFAVQHGLRAAVVSARAPAQALAAVAVYDPAGEPSEVLRRMAGVAAATRHGAVVLEPAVSPEPAATPEPAEEPTTPSGAVRGLVDDCVVTTGDDPAAVGRTVAERLLCDGGELLTVISGAAPGAGTLAADLCRHVRETAPDV
ncbi:MAG TPA: DAK2 domain-containing protein, partial [Actinomycetales bacterium]|nr:DAK2 domain-containing protein [Actinomycetales bacterium]